MSYQCHLCLDQLLLTRLLLLSLPLALLDHRVRDLGRTGLTHTLALECMVSLLVLDGLLEPLARHYGTRLRCHGPAISIQISQMTSAMMSTYQSVCKAKPPPPSNRTRSSRMMIASSISSSSFRPY